MWSLRLPLLMLAVCIGRAAAFSLHPSSVYQSRRQAFHAASVQFMSETEVETSASEAEIAPEVATVSGDDDSNPAAIELTPEEAAAKRKIQRERYTLFVGNLPFGTLFHSYYSDCGLFVLDCCVFDLCILYIYILYIYIYTSSHSILSYTLIQTHTDATDADIKAIFEPHGKVDLINIPRDRTTQKPRGFAFVDMSSAEALEAAIAAVDGTAVEGRELRVMKSVAKGDLNNKPNNSRRDASAAPGGPPKGTKKIYMGNIPFQVTKEEIKDFFSSYGEVVDVYIPQNPDTGVGRGFAFVTMKEEDAMAAIEATNGADFGGRTLVVNEPLPPGKKAPARKSNTTKLYVGNLSFYTVVETLEDIFGEFGPVVDCYLPEDAATGGSRGFGFVTMAREDALNAIKEIDGCEVDGRVIRVNEAQPKGGGGGGRGSSNNNNDMSDDEMGVISSSWDDMNDDEQ